MFVPAAAVSLLFSIDSSTTASSAPVPPIVVTTVCDLVSRPQDFNGRVVRVHARYESNGMDLSVLTDPMCQGGVMPTGHFYNAKVSGAFFEALHKEGCMGVFGDGATATWTGTYHWQPENTPGTGKVPRWLEVQKIENVNVKPDRCRKK